MTRLLLCTATILALTLSAGAAHACAVYTCDDPRSENYEGRLLDKARETARPSNVCIVNDPTDTPLNVRERPYGRILGALRNGVLVKVSKRDGKWSKIAPLERDEGKSGWVFYQYLECERERSRDAYYSALQ
jgi:Bacterial SH3 domain